MAYINRGVYKFCFMASILINTAYAQQYIDLDAQLNQNTEEITYYLLFIVNGKKDSQLSKVLYKNGEYWANTLDLTRNHFKIDSPDQLIKLNQLPQIKYQYIAENQTLEFTVPNEWLPPQYFSPSAIDQNIPAESATGIIFNYESYLLIPNQTNSSTLNTWLEQRFFSPSGVFKNTGVYRYAFDKQSNIDTGYVRFDTFWKNDNQANMLKFQIGDFVSNSFSWSNSTRLGGLQINRNFSIRPDIVTHPLLNYTGVSSTPSVLDLFINGNKVSSNDINAGPFILTNTPYINGAGEATVVTTDALGKQVSTTIPFYVSNALLRKGLSDFDISIGMRRINYGLDNFNYEKKLSLSTLYRYGINDYLTLATRFESHPSLTLWGAGVDILLGRWGVFSNSTSTSHNYSTGYQFTNGYSYQGQKFNFNIQHTKRTTSFLDLSVIDTKQRLSKQSIQSSLSFMPFGQSFGFIGLGYFDITTHDNSRTQIINLSYSHKLWKNNSLVFSINKLLNQNDFNSQIQFIFNLDQNKGNISASISRDNQNKYSQKIFYSKPILQTGDIGWNLGYGNNNQYQASLIWENSKFAAQGGINHYNRKNEYWAQLNGSFIYLNGLFATNKIHDAFLVVDTNKFPNVPVYYDNRFIGKTNKQGKLLVPSVHAYYPGKIFIDTLDLPTDLEPIETEKKISVEEFKGAKISFPIQKTKSAHIKFLDQNAQPLPIGTIVEIPNTNKKTVIGYDGWAYLTHLDSEQDIIISLPDQQKCQQALSLNSLQSGQTILQCPLFLTPSKD